MAKLEINPRVPKIITGTIGFLITFVMINLSATLTIDQHNAARIESNIQDMKLAMDACFISFFVKQFLQRILLNNIFNPFLWSFGVSSDFIPTLFLHLQH